jgi:DNA-binding transcriptional MocR family regulator
MSTPERLIAGLGDWRSARGPLFSRLADGLAHVAEQGVLPASGELPAERALAAELGISRATVAAAYAELRERGLAVTRHGSGTAMRNALPPAGGAASPALAGLLARESGGAPVIDLSVGSPHFDEVVGSLELSGEDLAPHVEGHGFAPLGWPDLRAEVAAYLSRRGVATSPSEVLITSGGQEAISFAVGLVAGGGRRIAVESPGYAGVLDSVARAGGRAIGIGRDAGGMRVDELKRVIDAAHVHAVFLAGSCSNPTGSGTAGHRREQLVALAAEHEFTIIEDTVLEELVYDGDPGPPLWSLAPDRVLAAGSVSKVAWGGLRVGWLRAPHPVVLRLGRIKGSLNLGAGAFDQLAALELFRDYEAVCASRRKQAAAHMDALLTGLARELPDWTVEPAAGGWSLWITLPTGSGAAFAQTALRHGVAIASGGGNSPDEEFLDRVRLCYGPAPALLDEAARRLASAWAEFVAEPAGAGALVRA